MLIVLFKAPRRYIPAVLLRGRLISFDFWEDMWIVYEDTTHKLDDDGVMIETDNVAQWQKILWYMYKVRMTL